MIKLVKVVLIVLCCVLFIDARVDGCGWSSGCGVTHHSSVEYMSWYNTMYTGIMPAQLESLMDDAIDAKDACDDAQDCACTLEGDPGNGCMCTICGVKKFIADQSYTTVENCETSAMTAYSTYANLHQYCLHLTGESSIFVSNLTEPEIIDVHYHNFVAFWNQINTCEAAFNELISEAEDTMNKYDDIINHCEHPWEVFSLWYIKSNIVQG